MVYIAHNSKKLKYITSYFNSGTPPSNSNSNFESH